MHITWVGYKFTYFFVHYIHLLIEAYQIRCIATFEPYQAYQTSGSIRLRVSFRVRLSGRALVHSLVRAYLAFSLCKKWNSRRTWDSPRDYPFPMGLPHAMAGFPWDFPWDSMGFPMASRGISHDIPWEFPWDPVVYPMENSVGIAHEIKQ